MPPKNLICIVVDRLHAGLLGAYGNSWVHTEHFDALACESFLFDQALVDCPRLESLYRSYWLGLPAVDRDAPPPAASLLQVLRAGGWHTALVTDEPEVASLPLAADFMETVLVDSPVDAALAGDVSETQMGRLFAAAATWLQTPRQPFCLWVHARGMAAAWDAPWELRNQYADEEDPPSPNFTAVPDRWLGDDFDPDELLGITHAYSGQVSLFDACLGALVDQVQQAGLDATTQLTFLGARGFPLGEHLRVGGCDDALYGETVQTAWLMRFPDGLGKLARSQALVLPSDLPGTLLDWLAVDRRACGWTYAQSLLPIVRDEILTIRDRVQLVSRHEKAIRTPAWLLRQPETGAAELYAKPGDRWEVNEVANLCPEIVSGLQAALVQTEQAGESGQRVPLDESLVREVD